MKGATGTSDIVSRVTVRLPICAGIVVEAYQAPAFSFNILSARLLVSKYEIMLTESIRSCSAYFFMKKETFNIIAKYEIKCTLYSVYIPSPTSLLNRKGNSGEKRTLPLPGIRN